MSKKYDIKGFQDVDSGNVERLAKTLELLETMNHTKGTKRDALSFFQQHGCHKLLDIGCGFGSASAYFHTGLDSKPDVIGIDRSQEFVELAKQRQADVAAQVQFQSEDVRELSFADNSFDSLYCERVLHHVENPQSAFSEINRVLKPGAVLCINEPDYISASVNAEPRQASQIIEDSFYQDAVNNRIGRELAYYAQLNGFNIIDIKIYLAIFTDLDQLKKILPIDQYYANAVDNGDISNDDVARFNEGLDQINQNKDFRFTLAHYTLFAQKPNE